MSYKNLFDRVPIPVLKAELVMFSTVDFHVAKLGQGVLWLIFFIFLKADTGQFFHPTTFFCRIWNLILVNQLLEVEFDGEEWFVVITECLYFHAWKKNSVTHETTAIS